MKNLLILILLLNALSIFSQTTSDKKILLSDLTIQIECTEAVDALYNFDFETAEQQFLWLKQQYPTHPLPYFLMGLSQWWRIMPNDIVTKYDDAFFAYMDTSVTFAEKLYKEDKNNPEASFFLAAAYGFKARLQSDRNNYTSAAFTSKKSLNYLHDERDENEELGPEFIFGDALYNYFREWIPENMPKLKPILLFFKKGDKELGLKQLKNVADNAFYTRVEAMTFLMRIYNDYENKRNEAMQYSQYLKNTYPNNPYFERYYAKVAFTKGELGECYNVSTDIINKVDSGYVGYDDESGRVASYFLGYINMRLQKDTVAATTNFKKTIAYSDALAKIDDKVLDRGYYLNAVNSLAVFAKKRGDKEEALKYYQLYLETADKKDDAYFKEAKEYVKQNEEKDDAWWKLW